MKSTLLALLGVLATANAFASPSLEASLGVAYPSVDEVSHVIKSEKHGTGTLSAMVTIPVVIRMASLKRSAVGVGYEYTWSSVVHDANESTLRTHSPFASLLVPISQGVKIGAYVGARVGYSFITYDDMNGRSLWVQPSMRLSIAATNRAQLGLEAGYRLSEDGVVSGSGYGQPHFGYNLTGVRLASFVSVGL